MAHGIEVGVLGPFEVRLVGGDPLRLGGLRQRALLAVLALNRNQVVSKDRLFDELWSGSASLDSAHTVQVFVSRLRQVLGPARGRLTTVGPGYRLELESDELDASRCEALYSRGRAEMAAGRPEEARRLITSALDLWRGPPLADFAYEPFAQPVLARLEELRVSCQEELVEAELALGDHAAVVQALETLVAEHPLRERPRGQLMLALYRCGRQAEALAVYQEARRLLVDELAVEPSAALRELEQAILRQDPTLTRGPASPVSAAAQASPGGERPTLSVTQRTNEGAFVGRADCLERLRSRWRETASGQTHLTLLVGQAGVGKTRLATQFAQEVHGEGLVLYGRADVESLLPYQPFAELLDHLVAQADSRFLGDVQGEFETLSRPFPNLRRHTEPGVTSGDQDSMRYQVFEAVVSVLARASVNAPLLIVLDDLHWADQPTLLLLRHLLRRAEGARLLVIGTLRPVDREDPLSHLLTDLRRERRYDRLELQGLDSRSTRELVDDRIGIAATPQFIERLREQTDGNAFFIEETLRALVEAGLPADAAVGVDALDAVGVPDGVAEVILRRTAQVSPLALELLTVGSVVGATFRLRFVEEVLRAERGDVDRELEAASDDRVASACDEILAAGLALEAPDRFEVLTFPHALVREVLYDRLTVRRRIVLHHLVALALERLSERAVVNPAELAHHFLEAKPIAGPEPARRYSIAAAQRAAEHFAYEESAAHLRRALALLDPEAEAARCDVLLALGRVQWHIGDDGARDTFLEAAESAERRGAADQLAQAAIGLGWRYFEVTYLGLRYRDLLEKALAAIGPADSPRRTVLLSRLAVYLSFPSEDARGQQLAADAVQMARRIGDARILVAALLARHITLLDVQHVEQRLALSQELVSLADGQRESAAESHHWRMYDLLGVGSVDAARQEHAELERLADRLGQPLLRSLAFGARGLFAELAGDADQAELWANESLSQARKAHTSDALSSWASQVFALRRRQGRIGEMTRVVQSLAASGGRQLGWLSALGVLHLETGDERSARAVYAEEMADGAAALPRGPFWLTRVALLSELCAGLGDADGAEEIYRQLLPHAGRQVVVAYCSFWGPVDRYLERLAETFGDSTLAGRHARCALEQLNAMNVTALLPDAARDGIVTAS